MKRLLVLLFLSTASGCDRPAPAERQPTVVTDSAATADSLPPDSVMARDTARQLPVR